MKALAWHGKGDIRRDNVPDPKIENGRDAIIKVTACAMAYAKLLSAGWTDALRTLYPDDQVYTFWSYLRNRWSTDAGLRLDHLLLSRAIAFRLKAAGVDRDVRGEPEASDHAPSWIELKSVRRGGTKRNRRSPP